jgi:hypothetical protein
VKDSDGSGAPCLKLAHLELGTIEPTGTDEEIGLPSFVLHGWALTAWSNTKMSVSWKDWRQDHRVESSDIEIDSRPARFTVAALRIAVRTTQGSCAAAAAAKGARPRALSNLLVSHPVPGIGVDGHWPRSSSCIARHGLLLLTYSICFFISVTVGVCHKFNSIYRKYVQHLYHQINLLKS